MWVCTAGGTPGTWADAGSSGVHANMVTTDTSQTITGVKTISVATLTDALIVQPNTVASAGTPWVRSSRLNFKASLWTGSDPASDNGYMHYDPELPAFRLDRNLRLDGGAFYEGTNRLYGPGNKPGVTDLSATGTKDATTYLRGDNTFVVVFTSVEVHVMSVTGALTVVTGKSRVYLEGSYTVETIRAAVSTAPTGSSLIVDVNKNGTTLFTTQGNRPTISASGFLSTGTAPNVTTFISGDYLTVDLDQVGSTIAGADLTVTVRLRRTA